MRAVIAVMPRRPVVLLQAAGLLLGSLGFRGRVSRCLRRVLGARGRDCAIMLPVMVPVLVTSMPLPIPVPAGRLIILALSVRLPLLPLRWQLVAGNPGGGRLTAAVVMRPLPAVPAIARTAVMASFALAFRALELGLRPAKTPDFFEFRLDVSGRITVRRLRCIACRQRRGLLLESSAAAASVALACRQ